MESPVARESVAGKKMRGKRYSHKRTVVTPNFETVPIKVGPPNQSHKTAKTNRTSDGDLAARKFEC